jgi:hypothetical protein
MTGIDWSGCVEEIPDEPARPAAANGHDTARPLLAPAAYHGLASEVVARILPNTESDSSALLLQFLVYFGNAVGRGPHYLIEQTQHFANLFVALVGQTSKSRKGTSAQRIRVIFNVADPAWASERILGGMSSGEGLIYAVRDPVYAMKKGVMELIDEGVSDKRLLLDEREFFQSLAVLKREGNTLSRVVRDAWDCCEHIGTLTKHSPTHASQPYISIAAHITVDELRQALDHTSMANGYANRYLFALVHRSKLLPHGSTQDAVITDLLGERTLEALTAARGIERITMTESAARHWAEIYTALAEGAPGLLGAITNRAEAQTIRLALVYALLDQAPQIDVVHLDAALAVWRFCEASARHIFGDTLGNPTADVILRALRSAGASGLTKTDLFNLFGRHLAANKIDAALALLQSAGKVRCTKSSNAGRAKRPVEMWVAA